MDRNNTLIKNTILYLIGNFSSSMLSFVLLPIYTRYLTPEDFGKVDVIFAVAFVAGPIISLQVAFACYRYLLAAGDFAEKRSVITNAMAVFGAGNFIFVVLFMAVELLVVPIEFGFAIMLYIVLGGISLFLQTLTRGLRENLLYTILGILSTATMLVANIIFIVGLNMKSISLLLAPICASLAVIVFSVVRLKVLQYIDFKLVSKDRIRDLLTYSVPLVPDAICWWLLLGFGRVYLNFVSGLEAVGILAVANKFPTLLTSVYSIFNLAWKENAITEYDNEDRDAYYSEVYNKQAIVILTGIIILLPATRLVINFLLGESFRSAYEYIPLLFISAAFAMLSSFWGSGFESAKKTGGIMVSTVFAFGVNFIFIVVLVPYLSIYGVAIANIAAYVALYYMRVRRSREFFKITTDKKRIIPLSLLALVFVGLYYLAVVWQVVFLFAGLGIFWCYNRAIIGEFLRRIRGIIRTAV